MKRTAALLFCTASLTSSFSFSSLGRERKPIYASVETTAAVGERSSNTSISSSFATNAILFSSWNDGIVPSPAAKSFLRYALTTKLLHDHIANKENNVEESVKFSPCNGPSVDALNNLEIADGLNKSGKQLSFDNFVDTETIEVDSWTKKTLQYLTTENEQITVKLLYIPTAMYALNPQSSNTPGKQRQRARSDGKKRRTQVLKLLETMLSDEASSNNLSIQTITLDLDDDSLKQPEGPDNSPFPENGKEALSSWNPTCIYVEGGNTFWLQHCIEKGEYSQYIVDACTGESGSVYCGKSAGAIVAGNEMSTASWKRWDDPSVVPNKQAYDDWEGTKGFQFAENISFFPHMDDQWTEVVNDKLKGKEACSTYCLREEEVCCINGERKKSFIVSG